ARARARRSTAPAAEPARANTSRTRRADRPCWPTACLPSGHRTHARKARARMKPLALLAAALLAATPALAQNAGQIASARRGASCAGCNLFQADLSRTELRGKSFAGARLRQADL